MIVKRQRTLPGRVKIGQQRHSTSSPVSRRRWLVGLVVLALLGVGAYAGRHVWLTEIGSFLVRTDPLQPAEIVVVLAGDGFGRRIMKAVELVRQGYAPRILVDGPTMNYGVAESDLAIDFAVRQGAARELFDSFPMKARSTMAEAQIVDEELRRRGIRKALVVTSNFHTRRARSIFRKHGSGEVEYVFVKAPHPDFDPRSWWRTRQGKKIVVLEYLKTFNSLIE